jgi:hypothetical protein
MTLATAYGTVRRHTSRQNNYDSWITSRDELQANLFRDDSKKCAKILSRVRHSPEFQQILKKIRKFKYSEALQKLREGVENFGKSEFGMKNFESTTFVILYDASERYLFDLVTIALPCLLRNDMSTAKFVRHREIIKGRTPAELHTDEVIFMPDQRSQKVTELFEKSVELRRGMEYFSSIQFYSSPLEINEKAVEQQENVEK